MRGNGWSWVFGLVGALGFASCGGGGGGGGGLASPPAVEKAHVEGRVLSMNPMVAGTVSVIPAAWVVPGQSVQPLEDLARTTPYQVAIDASGTFEAEVPAGPYYFFVTPDAGDVLHLPGGRAILAGGTKSKPPTTIASIALVPGQKTMVDVELSETPSPSARYVGSTRCRQCHATKLETAGQNLHFVGFRKLGWMGSELTSVQDLSKFPNADGALPWFSDGNPNDNTGYGDGFGYFHQTQDGYGVLLGRTFLGYYAYFTDGPVGSGNEVRSEKYDIAFGYGGEGQWRMLFVTRVDNDGNYSGTPGIGSYQVLPIQFNENEKRWVDYRASLWGAPVAEGGAVSRTPGIEGSWDVACGGCHANDVRLIPGTLDDHTPHLTAVSDSTMGPIDIDGDYTKDEINLGCERCHGPGSDHLDDPNKGSIVHPYKMAPGRGVLLCGQCHQRGRGQGTYQGVHTGYASRGVDADMEFWRAGQSAATFYGTPDGMGILPHFGVDRPNGFFAPIDLRTDAHSWQDASGGFGSEADSSKGYGQQYFDHVRSTHFANPREILTCFSCHAGHHLVQEHQIRASIRNNVLCLECHAERDDFADITKDMVAEMKHGLPPDPQIAISVHSHMAWKTSDLIGVAMNLDPALYDPTNEDLPVGRCTTCHMTKTAHQAEWKVDGDGFTIEGDSASHLMKVVSPDTSEAMRAAGVPPVTNSCAPCHGAAGTAWPDYRS